MHKRKGPPGRGAAAARQLGLLVDLSPDGLMIPEDGVNDEELEAEFLALVGGQPPALEKLKGKGPLPMEAIEKMASLCMRDLDEEEDEEGGTDEDDVEADDDLLAELNEVLGEEQKALESQPISVQPKPSVPGPGVETTLQERLALYQTAIESARQAGDSAKMRRYDRGLKTLENLLVSVRKGNAIDEGDIPPPVAVGKSLAATPSHTPTPAQPAPTNLPPPMNLPPPTNLPALEPRVTMQGPPPAGPASSPASAQPQLPPGPCSPGLLTQLQSRQREYKLAALQAKQQGDTAAATRHFRVAKSFDAVLEALSRGEPVDLSRLPPPPDQLPTDSPSPPSQPPTPTTAPSTPEVPAPPRTLLEALEQRMERYRMAAAQAKAKGDQRKARMHERIVKQYQDAIRAHKAGRAVEVAELPVPPGFPPIQGLEATEPAQQSLVGVLETAMKLANQDEGPEDEEDEEPKKQSASPAAPTAQPKAVPARASASGSAPATSTPAAKAASKGTSTRAQQQLAFLENRKKQLLQAALRAKQKNDVEGAKMHLRQAKGLEPMLEASRNGLPVDISKVPPAPVNKDDFALVQRPGPGLSQEAIRRYGELTKLIRQQHEICLNHSNQFTHLGNIAETSKFEKLAEDCKRSMETLKQAFARGLPTPAARFEQRTFSVIKIFPDLSNNDMLLFIVKGINLPTPPGLSPGDLDVFVRFDFPYPNVEEAQKDKTSVIKNTDSPEFKEQFKLCINRGHRGFRRAIQTKGIKFEVVHKGGLFKNDRVLGTAQLKLDTLETACEVREILEVLDGRRPTGGRLEVMVRIREPLTAQQLETTTERWLVIDPVPAAVPTVAGPKGKAPPVPAPAREPGNRPARPLHSLSVLAFDQERLERKILALRQARRPVPPEVAQQYQDIMQRSQWQRAQLEQGGVGIRREYMAQLERQLQFYTEAARRLGSDGSREAAKEALYRRNLVESELQRLRR
ncbi:coiled-coil and C2 domain-containing protein 1A [Orycteropus afer afer]|uniref:Coiled-coil and C2 domain-containing protein 1A n=1 Tax=Orycteropus afer afer TaxID=1230840 RepID=A0AC54ZEM5_ORYAF|nr:coiled-coil and C2 domain-containing protein 1A [Orycteropus afer afer]